MNVSDSQTASYPIFTAWCALRGSSFVADGREYFLHKDLTIERPRTIEKDFPFLESLFRFTYLDIRPMDNLFKQMDDAVLNFYQGHDMASQGIVIDTLGKLAKKHVYFKFLFLDWQSRFQQFRQNPDQDVQFQPISTVYERTGKGTFAEVLHPTSIYDLVEFSIRECVKREQRMRICSYCGKYFCHSSPQHGGILQPYRRRKQTHLP